jgi:RHS repeat-associated protein
VAKLPGSQSYNYAIPILNLPGRNGLDLNLTLYYNSLVWDIDSGGHLSFNADRDWPGYGFRLNFGYLEYNASNGVQIITEADGTKHFPTDGTYIVFNTSTNVVTYKNGTQVQYTAFPQSTICMLAGLPSTQTGQQSNCNITPTLFRPTRITDTNGNYISISYVGDTGSMPSWTQGQDIATITDTLGRVITFNYDGSGRLQTITQGVKKFATFTWNTNYLLNYNFVPTTHGNPVDSPPTGTTISVLTACTYPNGTGYAFGYGDWGIVNQIVNFASDGLTPRSSVAYNYPAASAGALLSAPTFTQQSVFDGVHTANWGYSVVKSGNLVSTYTVTDPANNKSVTTLFTATGFNQGMMSQQQLQDPSGTPLRTFTTTWVLDAASNPKFSGFTTVLNDSGQASSVAYHYTTNGNISEVDESDYTGLLVRKTFLTYLTTSAYVNAHILDRVTQVQVQNASGTVVGLTNLFYDNTVLFSQPGASNHDDTNYGVNFTVRGNLSGVVRYANAPAGTGGIVRNFNYDTTGNLVIAQLDCCNQKQWAYSVSTEYAYPDSVTSGPTGGAQLTTGATYDTEDPNIGVALSSGLVMSTTDANLQTTTFSYVLDPVTHLPDPMNRIETITQPGGVATNFTYDDGSALPSVTTSTSANSLQTVSTMDAAGREIRRDIRNSTSVLSTVQTTYDLVGRVTSRTNPYGPNDSQLSTSYSYDALSRVITVTPPSAGTYQYAYSGNAVTTTDPAGKQRRSFSDGLGRLVEVDETGWGDGLPGKGSVTIGGAEQHGCSGGAQPPCPTIYDSGTVSITVNGFQASTNFSRTSTATSIATALQSQLNGGSSPVTVGRVGTTLNLTAKTTGGATNYTLSTSVTWDSADFQAASFSAAPSGPNLTGGRDAHGPSDPSLNTPMITTYTYDALDDLTAVSQAGMGPVSGQQLPGQPRSYAYDGLGRLTSATTPESGTTTFSYLTSGGAACAADASAVCYKTDARSITSTYSYDGLNRVTGVSYSDGVTPSVAYGYDAGQFALGRLTSVTVGSGSPAESYTYDQLGRILTATETVDSTPYTVSYGYNPDNSLASIQYPSGRTVSQTYDAIGRMTTLASGGTNLLSGLSYNAAGQALGFTYGNQVAAAFTYNDHLQLQTLRYSNSTQDLLNLAYDYTTGVPGNNGQIQKVHYYTAPGNEDLTKSENFSYDPWSRLSTAQTTDINSPGTWGVTEHYDRFGNRQEQDVSGNWAFGTTFTVDPNTNRIADSGYAYDAAGNMTNDTNYGYTFDAENRITQVKSGPTVVASYTYLGALRVKRDFGGTTVYVYSGSVPIAEYAAGAQLNQPNKEYIYSGSQLLATVDASTGLSYQYPDHLSTRVEADANASVTRTFGHFPFGETWYETGAASKWKFTTYERDSESGLDYADFRYYSSRLGRFMQADLLAGNVGNPESLDHYTYVLNDPENLVDPLGLLTCVFRVDRLDGKIISEELLFCYDETMGGGGAGFIWQGGGGRGGDHAVSKIPKTKEEQCEDEARQAQTDALNNGTKDALKDVATDLAYGYGGVAVLGCVGGALVGAIPGAAAGPVGEALGGGGGCGAGFLAIMGNPVTHWAIGTAAGLHLAVDMGRAQLAGDRAWQDAYNKCMAR